MTDWYAHVTVATVVEKDGYFLVVEERNRQRFYCQAGATRCAKKKCLSQHQKSVRHEQIIGTVVRRLGWRLRVLQLRQAHLVGDMQRLRGVSELSTVLVHNRHDPR